MRTPRAANARASTKAGLAARESRDPVFATSTTRPHSAPIGRRRPLQSARSREAGAAPKMPPAEAEQVSGYWERDAGLRLERQSRCRRRRDRFGAASRRSFSAARTPPTDHLRRSGCALVANLGCVATCGSGGRIANPQPPAASAMLAIAAAPGLPFDGWGLSGHDGRMPMLGRVLTRARAVTKMRG